MDEKKLQTWEHRRPVTDPRSHGAISLGDLRGASRRSVRRNVLRNATVRVLMAMALSLFASAAVRNSATASHSNWEVVDPGGHQVAFDRRDDQGRIYFDLRLVPSGGKAMWLGSYAADCSKGLLYEYDQKTKRWKTPLRLTDNPFDDGGFDLGSSFGVGYKYVCAKYGR